MEHNKQPQQSEGKQSQAKIQNSTYNQSQSITQQLATAINNELKDENSNLGQFIRDQVIKRAALSFVEEFKSYLTNQKNVNQKKDKNSTLSVIFAPLPQESDQDDEDQYYRTNHVDSDWSSCQWSSSENDSNYLSSYQSEDSVFTFKAHNSQKKQILLEGHQEQQKLFEDILLESGEGRKHESGQEKSKIPKKNNVNKLKKKLKNKVSLSKKASGPKISTELYKKFLIKEKLDPEMQDETGKQKESKGVRKIQKMIQKLQINENAKNKIKQPESSSEQDSKQSQNEDSDEQEHYEDNFLDWEDLQGLHLNSPPQTENQQVGPLKSEKTAAMKKVKVQEMEDYSQKPIYIKVQINVIGFLANLIEKQQNSIRQVESNLQAINKLEKETKGDVQPNPQGEQNTQEKK